MTGPGVPPAAAFRRNRSDLLDCIRAVAILAVLAFHVATRYDPAELDPIARFLRRFGLLGVDIFFPLSGFLITRYLLREESPDFAKIFFLRRLFRIVPLYLVAVTAYLMVMLALNDDAEQIRRIWVVYLFLTGWFIFFEGKDLIPYTITWSLSVEEFAYILFGLCALISRRSFIAFLGVLSLGALALRIWLELGGHAEVYHFPPARLDSIAIGGLLAVAMSRKAPGLVGALVLLTAGTYALARLQPALWEPLKYSFITFGTCLAIALAERFPRQKPGAAVRALAGIGFYSYFTYLFHLFNIDAILLVLGRLDPGLTLPFWGVVALALAATHLQAVVSFRFFEGPVMQYGRRLERAAFRRAPPLRS
jgi:peptidoglycan/LPS O-acetylase OafA/YrhL